MTILQDKFIEHYVLTGNATQSAIHAGYSEKTAKVKRLTTKGTVLK